MSASTAATQLVDTLPFNSENLSSALSNQLCTPEQVESRALTMYLYGYLDEIGTKTIVVERDYTDRDYLEDYAAYYARSFRDYARRSNRVHFFDSTFTLQELLQVIRGEAEPDVEAKVVQHYCGFVVARPLPDAIIGRTVLRPYESDQGRRNYTCTLPYHVNLFGLELKTTSLAFQEQDTVLAACATVALWSCFHKTRELFSSLAAPPSEITRLANQVVHRSRPIPSHGLIVQQICNAIRQAGLEPEVVEVKPGIPLASLLYGHLKMGIPVILGVTMKDIGNHAIAVNGYSLPKALRGFDEVAPNSQCVPMVGQRLDEFYAHDDQVGPFSKLVIKPTQDYMGNIYPITFESRWTDSNGQPVTMYPYVAVIPVYNKVRVTFLDVQKVVTKLHFVLAQLFPLRSPLEWDISLSTTNQFKTSVKIEDLIPADSRQSVLVHQYPRYVWRSILRFEEIPLMEVIFDATDMARSFFALRVIWYNKRFKEAATDFLTSSDPQLQALLDESMGADFKELLTRTE